ncbi:MAG: glycoside hydrolase family 3 C-terminal domain-containing protein [Lentisphaerae bacterium]|nr:glycoside hydrolase family 3 C-terminal domain-containing protein [Lentisphaerota bacterium]
MNKPWLNKDLDIAQRADALLAEMTVEEKVGQLVQYPELYPKDADTIREGRIGSSILANSEWAGFDKQKKISVTELNALQQIAVEESRLGIPILFARDVIHGLRTIFPVPIAQASAWSPALVKRCSAVAAREARSVGVAWTFAPMIDVARDPRWGRIVEGFGEDPYLASVLAAAAVRGFQGDDPSDPDHMLACAKHFVAYGAVEGGRDYNTADISERTLHDIYLPPFLAAVRAGVAAIMTAYDDLAGVPCVCDRKTNVGVLREEWGFDGILLSDWATIGRLPTYGVAADEKECACLAMQASCDMDMCSSVYENHLAGLVNEGVVSNDALDDAARRVLKAKFLAGLFESPYTDPERGKNIILCEEHVAAAREAARESITLLRNEQGVLPLSKSIGSVAVVGPHAASRTELNGSWCADAVEEDVVTILDGIRSAVSSDTDVITAGTSADEIVYNARSADAVVLVVGEHPSRTGEAHCVSALDLPAGQNELIRAVSEVCQNVILVVIAGRPLAIDPPTDAVKAILYAWQPGMQGGHAVADILFGDHNPDSRLPVSVPRTVGQVPIHYNLKAMGVAIGGDTRMHSNYLDLPRDPLYPFGFGLGYTTFSYDNLEISPGSVPLDGTLQVSADITNTGNVPGSEVVQLYVRDEIATVTRPVKELKGFEKIHLEPGETRRVTFELRPTDLAYTRADMTQGTDPGTFRLWIGPNSTEGLEGEFEVE